MKHLRFTPRQRRWLLIVSYSATARDIKQMMAEVPGKWAPRDFEVRRVRPLEVVVDKTLFDGNTIGQLFPNIN